jgi:hypothetical protein
MWFYHCCIWLSAKEIIGSFIMFGALVTTTLLAQIALASSLDIKQWKDLSTNLTWIYKDPSLPRVMQVAQGNVPIRTL